MSLVLLLALTGSVQAEPSGEAGKLHALFAESWEWTLDDSPELATRLGDRRGADRWTDRSLASYEARDAHRRAMLDKLARIDRARLSRADQLNYDLFRKEQERALELSSFRLWLAPVNQRGGIQTSDQIAAMVPFRDAKDFESWIARLRAFPRLVDQTIDLMRLGMKERILWPKVVMDRVPAQLDKQIVDDPEASPFFAPFKRIPDSSGADRERLEGAGRSAVAEAVIPAMRKFRAFLVDEYLPACPEQAGIWTMPEGEKIYASRARSYTTTELTPREIHEIGLKEVARIRARMETIREEVGFEGTLEQFFEHLRTDPKFFFATPEELLDGYRAIAKRIDPHIVEVVKTHPRAPYGVVPIPDTIAPDTTTAYYNAPAEDGSRAGRYYVNLYRPETRPKWEMMALSLHEAVPGHHLQIAIAQELGEVPKFRRFGGYTAFTEGWALYAESLGEDMGLFDDPYSRFGQLTYEMWRAVRLVVDTGMHSMKWDRQKAIDYFMQNAAKTELDVTNEIDRYITMPGQALAYKIGELKMKELRAKASKELGARFDLREFHDVVLGSGALPLDILERNVDEWIAGKK
jgi:uncharacterized protein (DUF885 family)